MVQKHISVSQPGLDKRHAFPVWILSNCDPNERGGKQSHLDAASFKEKEIKNCMTFSATVGSCMSK